MFSFFRSRAPASTRRSRSRSRSPTRSRSPSRRVETIPDAKPMEVRLFFEAVAYDERLNPLKGTKPLSTFNFFVDPRSEESLQNVKREISKFVDETLPTKSYVKTEYMLIKNSFSGDPLNLTINNNYRREYEETKVEQKEMKPILKNPQILKNML